MKKKLNNSSKNQQISAYQKRNVKANRRKKSKTTGSTIKNSSSLARKKKKKLKQSLRLLCIEISLSLLVFLAFIVGLSFFLFQFPQNIGYGMAPNLLPDQRVLVYRYGKIKRSTCIFLQIPQRDDDSKTIRRVIGLPGERVEYRMDQLYINGIEQNEPYLTEAIKLARMNDDQLTADFSLIELTGENRIPSGYYLVMADNRTISADSRTFGLVPEDAVLGTVEVIF